MKNIVRALALAATLSGALVTAASAQVVEPRSKTSGVNIGLFLNGSAVQVEDSEEVESGGGLGLHLGYGFNQRIQLFARANMANIEGSDGSGNYDMAHFDLGVRYSFGGAASALRPFVQGALNGRAAAFETVEGDLEARGPGFTAGGGLEYFFSRTVALEAGLAFSFGEFNEGRLGNSDWVDLENEAFGVTTTRFDIGVSFHP